MQCIGNGSSLVFSDPTTIFLINWHCNLEVSLTQSTKNAISVHEKNDGWVKKISKMTNLLVKYHLYKTPKLV